MTSGSLSHGWGQNVKEEVDGVFTCNAGGSGRILHPSGARGARAGARHNREEGFNLAQYETADHSGGWPSEEFDEMLRSGMCAHIEMLRKGGRYRGLGVGVHLGRSW